MNWKFWMATFAAARVVMWLAAGEGCETYALLAAVETISWLAWSVASHELEKLRKKTRK